MSVRENRFVGTCVNDASIGTKAWSNPGNATADDNSDANTPNFMWPAFTNYLKGTMAGNEFAIPAGSTIDGIALKAEVWASAAGRITDHSVKIVKGGVIQGNDLKKSSSSFWPSSRTHRTWGHGTQKWGLTWTPADINAGNFGAVVAVTNQAIFKTTAYVDWLRMDVWYTEPSGEVKVVGLDLDLTYTKTPRVEVAGFDLNANVVETGYSGPVENQLKIVPNDDVLALGWTDPGGDWQDTYEHVDEGTDAANDGDSLQCYQIDNEIAWEFVDPPSTVELITEIQFHVRVRVAANPPPVGGTDWKLNGSWYADGGNLGALLGALNLTADGSFHTYTWTVSGLSITYDQLADMRLGLGVSATDWYENWERGDYVFISACQADIIYENLIEVEPKKLIVLAEITGTVQLECTITDAPTVAAPATDTAQVPAPINDEPTVGAPITAEPHVEAPIPQD